MAKSDKEINTHETAEVTTQDVPSSDIVIRKTHVQTSDGLSLGGIIGRSVLTIFEHL